MRRVCTIAPFACDVESTREEASVVEREPFHRYHISILEEPWTKLPPFLLTIVSDKHLQHPPAANLINTQLPVRRWLEQGGSGGLWSGLSEMSSSTPRSERDAGLVIQLIALVHLINEWTD